MLTFGLLMTVKMMTAIAMMTRIDNDNVPALIMIICQLMTVVKKEEDDDVMAMTDDGRLDQSNIDMVERDAAVLMTTVVGRRL